MPLVANDYQATNGEPPLSSSSSGGGRAAATAAAGGPEVLGEFTWNVSQLAHWYPPDWTNANKKVIANMVGDDKETPGRITASRWALPDTAVLPERMQPCANVRLEPGFFTYGESPPSGSSQTAAAGTTEAWYMNFADPYLFGHGEGPLLAQDELQIVEHPILCSLAKAIEAGTHGQAGLTRFTTSTVTTGHRGRLTAVQPPPPPPTRRCTATPVLVQGAPRRCRLDTRHIYGDAFARAPERVVQEAVQVLAPPLRCSNIVAVAAARPHIGGYTKDQILEIYMTAYTAFRATVLRQEQQEEQSSSGAGAMGVTLHTGHWGCGAFGGNKGLMACLQILAAGAAHVHQLVYWYGTSVLDQTAVEHGRQVATVLQGRELDEALQLLDAAGYRWGDANENHVPYCPPDKDLIQLLTTTTSHPSSNAAANSDSMS